LNKAVLWKQKERGGEGKPVSQQKRKKGKAPFTTGNDRVKIMYFSLVKRSHLAAA
jgi:hypothetical protein